MQKQCKPNTKNSFSVEAQPAFAPILAQRYEKDGIPHNVFPKKFLLPKNK